MTVIMSEVLEEKLAIIKRKTWWPATLLAEVLVKPRRYIYRKVASGDFIVFNDGGPMKITSESVVTYFENRHQNL